MPTTADGLYNIAGIDLPYLDTHLPCFHVVELDRVKQLIYYKVARENALAFCFKDGHRSLILQHQIHLHLKTLCLEVSVANLVIKISLGTTWDIYFGRSNYILVHKIMQDVLIDCKRKHTGFTSVNIV